MEFVNVKSVTIPEGDVTKIVETLTGRILWEKTTVPPVSTLKYMMVTLSHNSRTYVSNVFDSTGVVRAYAGTGKITGSIYKGGVSLAYDDSAAVTPVGVPTLSVNDTFKILAVAGGGAVPSALDIIDSGEEVTDAVWSVESSVKVVPLTAGGYGAGVSITVPGSMISFNTSNGSTVKITKLAGSSLVSQCSREIDEHLSDYPKTSYPYFWIHSSFAVTSSSLGISSKVLKAVSATGEEIPASVWCLTIAAERR